MANTSLRLWVVGCLALALVACGPQTSTPDDDDDDVSDDDDDDASDDDDDASDDDDDDTTESTEGDDDDDGDSSEDDDDDATSSDTSDTNESDTLSENDTSSDIELSLAADIQPIFDGACSCHTKSQPSAGLSLRMGDAHASLVNKANGAGLIFVKPGEPEASYLINKLENTQGDVDGGQGQMMPPKNPLSQDEIERILAWIAGGAKP